MPLEAHAENWFKHDSTQKKKASALKELLALVVFSRKPMLFPFGRPEPLGFCFFFESKGSDMRPRMGAFNFTAGAG